jgi:hypothetical protein
MMTPRILFSLVVITAATSAVPVRPLGKLIARSPVTFGNIAQVRQLSDGRVLVNDNLRRQVVMLDAALSNPRVIIDSAGGKENSYGSRSTTIIPYLADSTLFVEPAIQGLLVIDPNGKVARVIAIPPIPRNAAANLASRAWGIPAYHAARGLVFGARCPCPPIRPLPEGNAEVTLIKPDSSSVVAVNLVTRSVDTVVSPVIGWNTIRLSSTAVTQLGARLYPAFDEWAMAPDGSIAFLSQGFNVHWVGADGKQTTPVRLPFDWRRNTDDEKTRLADSINTVRLDRYRTGLAAFIRDSTARLISPEDEQRPIQPIPLTSADFPDFMPAFARNALRADADDNLWIRTTPIPPIPDGIVYDIVNRKGELFDRVQAPEGRTVVDFGRGGIVYLVARDGGQAFLEQARFK